MDSSCVSLSPPPVLPENPTTHTPQDGGSQLNAGPPASAASARAATEQPVMCCDHVPAASWRHAHYCSYLQVPALMRVQADAMAMQHRTVDDRIRYACLASGVLWLHLLGQELAAATEEVQRDGADHAFYRIEKRLRRCQAVVGVIRQQSALVALRFSERAGIADASLDERMPLLRATCNAAEGLELNLRQTGATGGSARSRRLTAAAAALLRTLEESGQWLRSIVASCPTAAGPAGTQPDIAVAQAVDADLLLMPLRASLQAHPGAGKPPRDSLDELMFIVAHQTFELWVPATLARIVACTQALDALEPDIAAVEQDVREIAALFNLFATMIHIPQTMTTADYLLFRHELRGTGAESIGFRRLEIALGQRDPRFIEALRRRRWLTDEMAQALEGPSLSKAYLALLRWREIVPAGADDAGAARAVARARLPTARIDERTAPIWLADAMVDVEQAVQLWRHRHLSMVDRMIGYTRSMEGAEGEQLGQSYLAQTLVYRPIFPYLLHG